MIDNEQQLLEAVRRIAECKDMAGEYMIRIGELREYYARLRKQGNEIPFDQAYIIDGEVWHFNSADNSEYLDDLMYNFRHISTTRISDTPVVKETQETP